jgi:hypothetical protein
MRQHTDPDSMPDERPARWLKGTPRRALALCLAVGLWSCDETDGAGDEEGDSDGGAEVAEDGAGGDLGEADGVGEDLVGDPAGDVAEDDVDDAATGDVAADLTDADVTTEVDTAVDIAGDIEDAAVDAIDDADGTGDAVSDSAFEEMWADFGVDASSDWDAYPLPDFCPEPWWSWDEWTTPCLAEDPDSCTSEDLHFNRHNLCMARSSSDVVLGTVTEVFESECSPGEGFAAMCATYRVGVEESLRGLSEEVVVRSNDSTLPVCLEVGDRGVFYVLPSGVGEYNFNHSAAGYFPVASVDEVDTVLIPYRYPRGVPVSHYMSRLRTGLDEMDPALCRCMRVGHSDHNPPHVDTCH